MPYAPCHVCGQTKNVHRDRKTNALTCPAAARSPARPAARRGPSPSARRTGRRVCQACHARDPSTHEPARPAATRPVRKRTEDGKAVCRTCHARDLSTHEPCSAWVARRGPSESARRTEERYAGRATPGDPSTHEPCSAWWRDEARPKAHGGQNPSAPHADVNKGRRTRRRRRPKRCPTIAGIKNRPEADPFLSPFAVFFEKHHASAGRPGPFHDIFHRGPIWTGVPGWHKDNLSSPSRLYERDRRRGRNTFLRRPPPPNGR